MTKIFVTRNLSMDVPSLKRSDSGTLDSKSVGLNFTDVRIRNLIVIIVVVIRGYDYGCKDR